MKDWAELLVARARSEGVVGFPSNRGGLVVDGREFLMVAVGALFGWAWVPAGAGF